MLALVLFTRLMRGVPEASLRREYRRRFGRLLRTRPDPDVIFAYVLRCLMHYHAHTMACQMATGRTPVFNTY